MTNGGKDVFIGHDKRPVSIVPQDEQVLINFRNGQILTDEFGNPLIVEVDTFFLPDATAKRSTSVVLPTEEDGFTNVQYDAVGIVTATYGNSNNTIVLQVSNSGVVVGDKVSGNYIPHGTVISRKISNTEYRLSENSSLSGSTTTELINIQRRFIVQKKSDPVLRVEEQFPSQSEVSSTLLGVDRAETQLSLFSDVSSYGLDDDEFEFFQIREGNSDPQWEARINETYGARYRGELFEETQESGIRIGAFPVAYSFPFGPRLERLGLYNEDFYDDYINFIQLGNDLHEYYNGIGGASYPDSWKRSFLNPGDAYVNPSGFGGQEVQYSDDLVSSFARIDTWTETFRDIIAKARTDPTTNLPFAFEDIQELTLPGTSDKFITKYPSSGDIRPGYSTTQGIYCILQSRRTFRYQPGRISGFTFGVRASTESKVGYTTEWGIGNPTDHYLFRISQGNLSIVRRSTVALGSVALARSGLTLIDQEPLTSGNILDIDPETGQNQIYQTIEVPSDNFNGDPLNGNGPSGYNLEPSRVTMWKIEFGWYGAIGCRFYAYIPAGNGEARWVVVHTFIIENSLGEPCLEDSYFKLRYSVSIPDRQNMRQPVFIYKYGASYYIDGGDEGTKIINSNSSGEKQVRSQNEETLIGIASKSLIYNSLGHPIINKRSIFPIKATFSSDILSEINVRECQGCPGFGHVYTPGLKTGSNGKIVKVSFVGSDKIVGINTTFHESDRGSKLIAPTLWNAYLEPVDPTGNQDEFDSANIVGYPGIRGRRPTSYVKTSREIAGLGFEYRDSVQNANVLIPFDSENGEEYPHEVRLSNKNNAVASSAVKFTGSQIDIQFVHPNSQDSYSHFADFDIGITSVEPDIDPATPTILDGWKVAGVTTSILPENLMLFGTHSHRFADINPLGVETNETYSAQRPPYDMIIDHRISTLSNPGGGRCALVTITIGNPQNIEGVEYITTNPLTSATGHFLQREGTFSNSVSFSSGQVAVSDVYSNIILPQDSFGDPITYISEQVTYQVDEDDFSFIEISDNITTGGSIPSTGIVLVIRPLRLVSSVHDITKIYNFNPYPLYFVAKLGDNSVINNISIKETIGTFTRTVAPVFAVTSNVTVDRYLDTSVTPSQNRAESDGSPPTNFEEVDRLSSALIDNQNTQQLRPTVLKDVFYIGENESKIVDMSGVFGPDRTAITPNLLNTEATFFTAKTFKNSNNQDTSGTIEMGINYGEQ